MQAQISLISTLVSSVVALITLWTALVNVGVIETRMTKEVAVSQKRKIAVGSAMALQLLTSKISVARQRRE